MAEVILHALSPKIVVFSSEEVKNSCSVNGLRNLDELFKPWQTKIEKGSSYFDTSREMDSTYNESAIPKTSHSLHTLVVTDADGSPKLLCSIRFPRIPTSGSEWRRRSDSIFSRGGG
jgi:hypothetical protein